MKQLNIYELGNTQGVKDSNVQDGLLFIPDISGYTEFVHSTDVLLGRKIIYDLLSTIIGENNLHLNIAEVEGDAILYYRYGNAPSVIELVEQFEKMRNAFERKREELEYRYSLPVNLSLKVIAHYGSMTEFNISHFKKLYGEVVIEAHRLLKNSIGRDSYLLLTDALLAKAKTIDFVNDHHGSRSNKLCEVYGALRNICFTYFDYSEVNVLEKVA